MKRRYCLIASLLTLVSWTSVSAATEQDPTWVMSDGSAFLWVEAETLLEDNVTPADTGFLIVDKVNPYITPAETGDGAPIPAGGIPALPENTNALGGTAILDLRGGSDTATYELQFTIPGRYFLYGHISLFNSDANTNYGNEDSIYLPPAFDKNSRDDWIGWEGLDELGDPKTGDSNRDGWMATPNNRVIIGEDDPGVGQAHNDTNEEFWNGEFWWHRFDVTIDVDADNNYVDDFGHLLYYDVSEEDVGKTLRFEISSREAFGAHDGFLFSTSDVLLQESFIQEQLQAEMLNFFSLDVPGDIIIGDYDENGVLDGTDIDLQAAEMKKPAAEQDLEKFDHNNDGVIDVGTPDVPGDRLIWVKDLRMTSVGDSNLDDVFDSGDLVLVFSEGKYDTGEMATWAQGDWSGDMLFESGDLVLAFQDGGYVVGAAPAVPEPSSLVLALLSIAGLVSVVRRRNG